MSTSLVLFAGASPDACRARELRDRAAARPDPLLIVAEEGIDTAAIARYIHEASRPDRPFIEIDCAARPQEVEVEVFGSRERASGPVEVLSSGAALLRAGRGTLFLQGAADLPAATQRRLARLLRDGEARAAGRQPTRVEARLIASAAAGLATDVRDGRFRSDLYRRLSALELVVSPLRKRSGDFATIVPLVAEAVAARLGRRAPSFTQSALTVLASLPWRRNIEELERLLERLMRAVDGDLVRQEDVLAQLSFDGAFARRAPAASLREARLRFEREYIEAVLEHHHWRMSAAARALGIERANLYRKTRQLGISRAVHSGAAHR